MTLEQSTRRILMAVQSQDLEMLQAASKERASIIALLAAVPPTPTLCEAVAASIVAGEEAQKAIHAIRHRVRKDSRRLANIEHGFLRVLQPSPIPQIDYKG
jgi:hypothetical protein